MNKALAEIIAGVIPHKMTRNRWRGILRYGPIKALKLKYRLKHDTTVPKYYLTVCAIAKMKVHTLRNGLNGTGARGSRNSTSTIMKVQIVPERCLSLI